MKKKIIRYTTIVLFFFLLGFYYSYHLPDFKVWAIDKIEQLSQENTPVRVLVSNIDFHLFPIGVSFENIRLTPQNELDGKIKKSFVRQIKISVNPLSFMTGLFQFSKIEITEPNVHIQDLEKLITSNDEKPKNPFDLKAILKIPINNFIIHRMDLKMDATPKIPEIILKNFSLEIENQKVSALISLVVPQLYVYDPKIADVPAEISIGSRILVQEDQILLSALKIKKGESYLLAAGYSETPIKNIKFDQVHLKIKSHLELIELKRDLMPFLKNKSIPDLQGVLDSQTVINKKSQSPLVSESKFQFKNLKVDNYYFGQMTGQAFLQDNVIKAPIVQIQNNSGKINLKDLEAKIAPPISYSANIELEKVQLQEVLKNLGLGEVSVLLQVSSKIPCKGDGNTSLLKCEGSVQLNNLRVYGDKDDIVKAEKATVKGVVEVTKEQVLTSAQITLGDSTIGTAKGFVHYDKGFQFEYDSPTFSFKDVDIAGLDLLGTGKLKGSTQGNSNKATFWMDIKTEESWLKNYYLGDFFSNISYKSGDLKFKNIDGLLRTTKYLGDLTIDLRKDRIKGNVHSPYIELSDLQKAFSKIATLPFEIYGGGTVDAKFSGPLEFNLLSYELKSKFLNGSVASESFDEVVYDVSSKDGFVTADKAFIKKAGGLLTLTGTAKPSGMIDTRWIGKNFTLQSINSFAKTELNMDADLNFDLALTEHILSPKSLLRATLTKTHLSQEKVQDSSFALSFSKNTISGTGKILGDKIDADFILPLSETAPFKLNARIEKWDFTPIIHLISSKSRAQEFTTLLSADITLSSQQNGYWDSNGDIALKELRIQRGVKELQLVSPSNIHITKGQLDFKKTVLRGDNTSLEVNSVKAPDFPISFQTNGKIDLGLLSFITPFFDDLKGVFALTTQVSFSKSDWKILGSGFINDGYIRTEALPHPFENITADLLFSDDRIILNRISSQFASGKITGEGNVEIKGVRKIKTDFFGKFDSINLKIPKDISTRGSGDFHISGDYFPYLFEGNYIISGGSFTKQLDGDEVQKNSFKRSQLLPKSFLQKNLELLFFDFDLIFNRGVDIKNDLIDTKAYGKLHLKGPPTQSVLTGLVQLQRNGKLFFRDTIFEIENAELKFNDPTKTNPDMYISGNTVVDENIDNRTQRYEIKMLIQGRPEKYSFTLTSNPPRSDKDIISLLALGVTTENNLTQTSDAQLAKQSYEVGATLLTKNQFGRDLQNKTGLDFKASSTVDQKTNTASPKITISKQWTPKIGTKVSRTFGESTTQDVQVEYHLNKNVSLIGTWEGREISSSTSSTTQSEKKTTDILGIDIEYRVEFK